MAKQLNAKIKKSYRSPISRDLTVYSVKLAAQDISNWQTAINAAKSAVNPRRKLLYTLYDNIRLDGHLISVIEKRRQRLTNKKIVFDPKGKDGETVEWINDKILETPWFYSLNKLAGDKVAWGHALIELIPKGGFIETVEQIDRINVRPEDDFMQFSYANYDDGINYMEDPYYSRYLMAFGGKKDYGLLMPAAQYAIYKRGGFGDWAQFAELFGMPFRVGKYNPYDTDAQQSLKTALEEMSGAGFAAIPDGTDIDFKVTNASGQSDVYQLLIEACNAEMSKIFLGQTMTTEDGSSHSQSETHREVENDIILSDMIEREYALNWELIPKLKAIGYPIPEGRFRFEIAKEMPKEKLIDIALKVSEKVPIADEWWYETFEVEKPDASELKAKLALRYSQPGTEDPEPPKETPKEGKDEKKPKAPDNSLEALYRGSLQEYTALMVGGAEMARKSYSIMERMAKDILDGKLKSGDVDAELFNFTQNRLMKGAMDGFGKVESAKDVLALGKMYNNISKFAGFKTAKTIKELKLLADKDNYKEAAKKLDDQYNGHYLYTEHSLATTKGVMAKKWQEFQNDKEIFPYLRVQTVGDDNVRQSHVAYDGLTLPVDHPRWKTFWPPFDWGCRCDIIKVRDAEPTSEEALKKMPPVKPLARNNVGADGTIFDDKHPYFKAGNTSKVKGQINSIIEKNYLNTVMPYFNDMKEHGVVAQFPDMDKADLTVIHDYTRDGSYQFNPYLLAIKQPEINVFTISGLLNAALKKLPDSPGITFRGIPAKGVDIEMYRKAMVSGKKIKEPHFFSTSKKITVVKDWDSEEEQKRILYVVKGKTGKDVSSISYYGSNFPENPQQHEILFNMRTGFYVKDIVEEDLLTIIYFEE